MERRESLKLLLIGWFCETCADVDMKILGELLCCVDGPQMEQLFHEVYDVAIRTTAEAMKAGVHLHAWCSVGMERAAGHAVS